MPYIGLKHIEKETLHPILGVSNAKDVTSTEFWFSKGDIFSIN